MSYRKIGGLHFVRVGSLAFSFCQTRKHPSIDINFAATVAFVGVAIIGIAYGAAASLVNALTQ